MYVCMFPAVLSSQCVEALQPPINEEAVCLVGRVLVVTSSRRADEGEHGLVFLPLRRLLPIFLIIIPEE